MMPRFLRSPDPDRDPDKIRRLAIAYPSMVKYQSADRPLLIDNGFGEAPLDLDTALQMFERLADEVLP